MQKSNFPNDKFENFFVNLELLKLLSIENVVKMMKKDEEIGQKGAKNVKVRVKIDKSWRGRD